MPTDPTKPPGGGDKPPGAKVFKSFEEFIREYDKLKQEKGLDFEFILVSYEEK